MHKNNFEYALKKKQAFLKPAFGLLVLLLMAFLVLIRTESINKKVEFAVATKELIKSDDDFFRAPFVLDRDFRLIEYLRKHYPYGTKINLNIDGRNAARTQGLRLALLPKYVITRNAILTIYAKDLVNPNDTILEVGDKFVLVKGVPQIDNNAIYN